MPIVSLVVFDMKAGPIVTVLIIIECRGMRSKDTDTAMEKARELKVKADEEFAIEKVSAS